MLHRGGCHVIAGSLALGFCAAALGQNCLEWKAMLPTGRNHHAMVYDEARQVVVMFGGETYLAGLSGDVAETWEWNGTSWSLRTTQGPVPRKDPAMAYDSQRGVVVMFGGEQESTKLGDTWEWNGQTWSLRSTTGPSPRYGHRMAYDPVRGVTVMAGGFAGGAVGGTWEWNGQVWTLRSTGGAPATTAYGSMFYDTVRRKVMAFNGAQTWEYDGVSGAWTDLNTPGPLPLSRLAQALAYDTVRGVAVLYGGFSSGDYQTLADTWEWRSADGLWVSAVDEQPRPRAFAAMAYDAARRQMVLAGGSWGTYYYADLWLRDGAPVAWRQELGDPVLNSASCVAYDSQRKVTVLFTRETENAGDGGQTWEWNGSRWKPRTTIGPSRRGSAAMAYDSRRGVTVLFGGAAVGVGWVGDTWEWDGNSWTQVADSGPTPRGLMAMAFDAGRGVCVLYGGANSAQTFSDTWEWDGAAWTQVGPPELAPRRNAVMAFDSWRNTLVLFGGQSGANIHGDTWEWTGKAWVWRTGLGPRQLGAMTFDERRGVAMFVGGSSTFPHWWEWNGSSWQMFNTTARINGSSAKMVFDSAHNAVVLLGGLSMTRLAHWQFQRITTGCPGDVNLDGVIDVDDLVAVILAWGPCAAPPCPADLTGDGEVDVDDLTMVIVNWT